MRNQSTYEVATVLILRCLNWAVTGNRGFGLTIHSALVGWVGVVANVLWVVMFAGVWGSEKCLFECAEVRTSASVMAGELWFAM